MRPRLLVAVATLIVAAVGSACSSGSGPDDPTSSGPPSSVASTPTATTLTTSSAGTGSATSAAGAGSSTGTDAPYSTSGPVPSPQNDQTGVLDSLPGSPAATCGAVGSQDAVRAGSIAIANVASARTAYHAHGGAPTTVTLFVIPQQLANVTGASVTVTAANGQAATRTAASATRSTEGAVSYFPVALPVGGAGPYRLTVTAGANRGCFDVTFS